MDEETKNVPRIDTVNTGRVNINPRGDDDHWCGYILAPFRIKS